MGIGVVVTDVVVSVVVSDVIVDVVVTDVIVSVIVTVSGVTDLLLLLLLLYGTVQSQEPELPAELEHRLWVP